MKIFLISFIVGGFLAGTAIVLSLYLFTGKQSQITSFQTLSQTQTEKEIQPSEISYEELNHPITNKYNVPILMFHNIRDYEVEYDEIGTNLSVSPENLEKHLVYLKDNGYTTVTFENLATKRLPKKPIIITFDDGYSDAYTQAYPLLKKHGMRGVFFVVSGLVDKKTNYASWIQLSEMANNGMELGIHTVSHADLSKLTISEQDREIRECSKSILRLTGFQAKTIAYPSGKYNKQSIEIVRENGLVFGVTTKSGVVNEDSKAYELPRLRINNKTEISSLLKPTDGPQATPDLE